MSANNQWPAPSIGGTQRQAERRSGRPRVFAIIGVCVAAVVVLGGVILFSFGEDLFGSDQGSIDSYNREILETCEVPAGSTLVRSYVLTLTDISGTSLRTMSFVYASPLSADESAAFYGLERPGFEEYLRSSQACRLGNRPIALVLALDDALVGTRSAASDFWGGDDTLKPTTGDLPPGTRSFVRLRLGQREVEGVFGLAPDRISSVENEWKPT